MAAKRQVSYQWRLREVMAAAGLFNASDLEPLLADRGITLSSVQVWRLVTQTPERLSLPVLAALCDIFDVTPAQLIATRAENVPARRRAASGRRRQGRRHGPERDAPGSREAAARAVTPEKADLRPVRKPPLPLSLVPRGASVLPVPDYGAADRRDLSRLRHRGPAAARPARRGPGLPGLRRHRPRLFLPALRHRNRHGPGRQAIAAPAVRPVRGGLDGRPAAG